MLQKYHYNLQYLFSILIYLKFNLFIAYDGKAEFSVSYDPSDIIVIC